MRPMEYEIIKFSIDDYDSMIKVWKLAGLPYKPRGRDSRDSISTQMEANPGMFRCCMKDGQMVGVVIGSTDGRRGYINRLAVIPECRNKGIAKTLLDSIEEYLDSLGLGIITVLIEDESEESMELFKARGYYFHEDIHYLSKRESPDV